MHVFETFLHLFHPRRSNNHRPKILHPEAIASLSVTLIIVSILFHFAPRQPLLHSVLGYSSDITPDTVLTLTNRERQAGNLLPLTINDRLSQAALAKGQDMFSNQYWAHTSPAGREPWDFIRAVGYGYRIAGENLARDFSTTDTMMAAWMASPTHRANILHPRYREIGIGVIDGTLLGVETTLVVQMFGLPIEDQVAQIPDSSAFSVAVAQAAETTEPTNVEPLPPDEMTSKIELTKENTFESEIANTPVTPEIEEHPTLLSPLEITRATFIAVVMLLVFTLLYDMLIISNKGAERFVGKNLAHIAFFMLIFFMLIFFKGGTIT